MDDYKILSSDETREKEIAEDLKHETREYLAKFIHEDVWAHWMKYLFDQCISVAHQDHKFVVMLSAITENNEMRWRRQMNTNYEDLPESEKESDRKLADKLVKYMGGEAK